MTKKIRLIVLGRDTNHVALVEILTVDYRVRARAVLEDHEPPLAYETPYHFDERTALAEVATWLRSRCNASTTCLATAGGVVVAISGDPTLRVKGVDPEPGERPIRFSRAG